MGRAPCQQLTIFCGLALLIPRLESPRAQAGARFAPIARIDEASLRTLIGYPVLRSYDLDSTGQFAPQVVCSSDGRSLAVQDLHEVRIVDRETLKAIGTIDAPSDAEGPLSPLYLLGASGRPVFACAFGRPAKLNLDFHFTPARMAGASAAATVCRQFRVRHCAEQRCRHVQKPAMNVRILATWPSSPSRLCDQ